MSDSSLQVICFYCTERANVIWESVLTVMGGQRQALFLRKVDRATVFVMRLRVLIAVADGGKRLCQVMDCCHDRCSVLGGTSDYIAVL
jgi:hypothetical protein